MAFLKIIQITTVIFLLINGILTFKLNVPRILLPIFQDIESKFVLEDVEGGCFKWATTREDLIQLEPIDINEHLDCSTKVLITTITKQREKSKSVITAEDVINNNIVLKCDVIVDIIHNLTITTTTKELYIDDVPEIFQINAYDQQGNEFSTLQGIEFDWRIESKSSKKDDDSSSGIVVKYLPFKESPYEAPPGIDELENQNKKGSIILLQGLDTGVATITVKMHYPEYQHIDVVQVQLIVMANIILLPHEAYVMVGDVIEFTTLIIQNGKSNRINLKDYQYYLRPEDDEIVHIDNDDKTELTALKLGYTKVILTNLDNDMNNELIKLPYANVYVVEPFNIVLNILPHKNWAILVGDQYDIIAELYTDDNHKIQIGTSTKINIELNDSFHIEEQCNNGSWLTGWGLRYDKIQIEAKLEYIEHPKLGKFEFNNNDNYGNNIKTIQELLIYPRIKIIPSEIILPWDPIIKPKYQFNLTVTGGDGRFLWTSTNTTIGLVTTIGQVHTLKDGEFNIIASMLRNHHNRQFAKFRIIKPVRLEIIEYIMEGEVDQPIYIHVMLYGERYDENDDRIIRLPFTICQDLPLQIKLSDNRFYVNNTDKIQPIDKSCGNIAIIGKDVATCKVTVIYQIDNLILERSVIINTYNRLKLIQPEGDIVLSVGSSINLLYEGGPIPLIGRNTQHQRIIKTIQLNNDDDDIIEYKDISSNYYQLTDDSTVVTILCRKLGQIDLQLEIVNIPILTIGKMKPGIIRTHIYCGKPRHIRLQPELKQIDTKSCPIDINANSLIIPINTNTTLNVDIYDDKGRLFKNASTFILNWDSSIDDRIKFYNSNGIYTKQLLIDDKLPIANGSEQIINATPTTGSITITTKILSYDKKKLKKYSIVNEFPEFIDKNDNNDNTPPTIETTLNLLLMNNTSISHEKLIIFNQPNIKRTIHVLDGSGYLKLNQSTNEIATIVYNQKNRLIEIIPIKPGELLLEINDVCLLSEPILIPIQIVTVNHIKVEMFEKVEIHRCIECIVKLYDEQEQPLEIDDLDTINLKYRVSKQIIDLKSINHQNNQITYLITGIEIGYTDLVFNYEDKDHEISSSTIPIQVFEPLKVYPRNTTILIGTKQQLTIKGGPYPDANIEFISTNNNVEIDNNNGIITGNKLGTTEISIKSTGINTNDGTKIIYAEDQIIVNIVRLNGIRIAAPLTKLRIGTTVPVWVNGIPQEITPIILGSLEHHCINFDWQLEQNGIASISDKLNPLGITYTNQDRITIHLTGINVGITRLTINATIVNEIYTTYYDFEIIDGFNLIQPSGLTESVLIMAPFSRLQIKTNFDHTHDLTYSLPTKGGCEDTTKVIFDKDVFDDILDVTDHGELISTDRLGFALLAVTVIDKQHFKRSLTYVIQVKPIHYMMITIAANWRLHFNSNLNVIPVGTEIDLIPKFYDNLGNEFHALPVNIEIRANRHDLIKLNYFKTNNTIRTTIKKKGITIIKIWTSGDANTADYIRLHTQDIIKPVVTHMVSGDLYCLWSPIVSRDLLLENWNTSNPDVLSIDNDINIAIAKTDKETNVFLTNPLHPSVPLFFHILPISIIELLPPPDLKMTNGPVAAKYRIPLVLKSSRCQSDKYTNVIQGWRCDLSVPQHEIPIPFKCFLVFTNLSLELDATEIFTIESDMKLEMEQYRCKIYVQEHNYVSHLATIQTDLSLWAITDDGKIESEHIIIPFLPHVDIQKEIRISAEETVGVFDIIGLEEILKQIEVEPADSSIIYTDAGTLVSSNLLRYRVQVIDYHWKLADLEDTMGVRVKSPITNQDVTIMVIVEDGVISQGCRETWLSHFLYTYRHSVVILLSALFIFFLTCYVYSRYMQPVVNVNVDTRRSLLHTNYGYNAMSRSPTTIPRLTTTHTCGNKLNCSCNNASTSVSPLQNISRGPVYGDNSFSINSPELRRNRRFL